MLSLLCHPCRGTRLIFSVANDNGIAPRFWTKNLTLALWEFGWTIWKHWNEIIHDSTGVERIPKRELNDSVTQER
jgi:hypothetical protein